MRVKLTCLVYCPFLDEHHNAYVSFDDLVDAMEAVELIRDQRRAHTTVQWEVKDSEGATLRRGTLYDKRGG